MVIEQEEYVLSILKVGLQDVKFTFKGNMIHHTQIRIVAVVAILFVYLFRKYLHLPRHP